MKYFIAFYVFCVDRMSMTVKMLPALVPSSFATKFETANLDGTKKAVVIKKEESVLTLAHQQFS